MPSARCAEPKQRLIEVVPGLMIWTLIAFGITFFVLKRFAFGPIQKTIDERRDRIRQAVEEADNARAEARQLLEQHRALLGQAKGEAGGDPRRGAQGRRRAARSGPRRRRRSTGNGASRTPASRSRRRPSRALDQIRTEVADLTLEATSGSSAACSTARITAA